MYNLEIEKFLIHNPKKSKIFPYCSFSCFKKNDIMLTIGQTKLPWSRNKKILELIFESFKKHYQNPLENFDGGLELRFENALQKTNRELQLKSIKKEQLEKCALAVAAVKDKTICFAFLGKETESFLIRKNKIVNILNDKTNSEINPLKVFSHLTLGELKNNDYLIFCNSSLLDYFSQEKLKKIILGHSPQKACLHLKSLAAAELESTAAIAAIILKFSLVKKENPEKISQSPLPQEKSSSVSTIYPGGFDRGVKPRSNNYIASAAASGETKHQEINSEPLPREENLNRLSPKTRRFFCLSAAAKILSLVPLFLTKMIKTGLGLKIAIEKFKKEIAELKTKFKSLSSYRKIIFLASLFFLLLFIQSIAFLAGRQIAKKHKFNENKIKMEIQNKQTEIEILLNYKNKEKAKKLLKEIESLIKQLPSWTKERKDLIAELEQKNRDLFDKAENIFAVKPLLTINFSPLKENFYPQKFLLSQSYLYAFDFEKNILSKTNIQDKKTSFNEIKSAENFNDFILLNEKNLLFLTKDGKLFKFSPEKNELNFYNLDFKKEIKEMKIYQDKLFLFDVKNSRILKCQKAENGFSEETDWLKEKIDLNGAISFAVDGSIYFISQDGQISKFYKGKKQDFNLSGFKNWSLKPTKIFADSETEFIYLLDSSNKKIIIADKNGEVQKQLKNEKISEAKEIIASEKSKKIYFLAGKEILEIKMP